MPISLDEEIISLPQAAAELPGRPHASTTWRYAHVGIRGVRLETLKVGGKVFTSKQAVRRFIVACNGGDIAADPKLASRRKQQIADAERRVRAAGL